MPPASLCMSYGVELEIPGVSTFTAVLTQEEIIYMKQTWSRDNPEKLHLNSPQVKPYVGIVLDMDFKHFVYIN